VPESRGDVDPGANLVANGSFEVGPQRSKEDVYMTIAARTRAALEKAGLDVTLVGPALVSAGRPFSKQVLQRNVTENFDVFSVHCYGAGNLTSILSEMPQWARFKNRKGQPMDYWQSEGQPTVMGAHTWLKTSGHVLNDPLLMARDAAGTVQMLASLKAAGFKKNFHYLADAHPAGRLIYRNDWHSMIDVNGIPYSPLPAHAAAVHFLEDAIPAGFRRITVGDAAVTVCAFTRNGRTLDVVWSGTPVSLLQVQEALGGRPRHAFDMMANPLAVDRKTDVAFAPVYLEE